MATTLKKPKASKKIVASSKPPVRPPKIKISKFGKMMGSYPDIKEIGNNIWDL